MVKPPQQVKESEGITNGFSDHRADAWINWRHAVARKSAPGE
jgi:hypothetical protein